MSKARWICIDVESYRTVNPAVIERISEKALNARPAQNTAKAEKERWDTQEGQRERIERAVMTTSCDPLLATPLVFCAKRNGAEVITIDAMERPLGDALVDLADLIMAWCDNETVWTGHAIEGYDLPLIVVQLQRLGLSIPDGLPVYRRGRWSGRVWDTMTNTPCRSPFISLADVCMVYGIAAKGLIWRGEPMTGSRVAEAYETGEYQIIRDYCAQDVIDESALFLAQTCGGTWGIGGRSDATAQALAEIAESTLTPAQKWLSAVPLLRSAGLL